MSVRIVFVPWSENESAHFVEKSLKWQKAALLEKDKNIKVVIYCGSSQHHMSSLSTGVIYIQGHGLPGQNRITSGGIGAALSASDVATRLIETGLSAFFRGKIKCWSCFSGEGGANSFSQNLADEMYDANYRSCQVYGYEGALDGYYATRGADGQLHRFSDDPIYGPGGQITGWDSKGRAKDNRHLKTPSGMRAG